ncbi:MAG: tail fiber domain-containing protein [Bacteroidota bacterium]
MKKSFIAPASFLLLLTASANAQNVGIGTASPIGKLHIKGDSDTSQVLIDANTTQGKIPVIRIRSAAGNDLLRLHADTSFNLFLGLSAGANNSPGSGSGLFNTFLGSNAGVANTTGSNNTAIGRTTLFNNATASDNTAIGFRSLFNNSAPFNTAVGSRALEDNGEGQFNTAVGAQALHHNQKTNGNTAVGYQALSTQSFADPNSLYSTLNTAVGFLALSKNNPNNINNGKNNTGIGGLALYMNTVGYNNTAVGAQALTANSSGFQNTAVGAQALLSNGTGSFNSAFGNDAFKLNTSGHYNTALGHSALFSSINGSYNVAVGSLSLTSLTTGSGNTAVGDYALVNVTTGNDNVAIGQASGTDPALPGISNTVSIGNHGWMNGASNQVFLGNNLTAWIGGWKGWSIYSDGRIKTDVNEDVKGLDFINRLRPVTYLTSHETAMTLTGNTNKSAINAAPFPKTRQSGFIAQEVESAAIESGYDFDGVQRPATERGLYSMNYAGMVVPLVKAVQEQQQIIADKQQQIDALKARLDRLEKMLVKQ